MYVNLVFSSVLLSAKPPDSPVSDVPMDPLPATNNNSGSHYDHSHRRHSSEDAAFSDEESEDDKGDKGDKGMVARLMMIQWNLIKLRSLGP